MTDHRIAATACAVLAAVLGPGTASAQQTYTRQTFAKRTIPHSAFERNWEHEQSRERCIASASFTPNLRLRFGVEMAGGGRWVGGLVAAPNFWNQARGSTHYGYTFSFLRGEETLTQIRGDIDRSARAGVGALVPLSAALNSPYVDGMYFRAQGPRTSAGVQFREVYVDPDGLDAAAKWVSRCAMNMRAVAVGSGRPAVSAPTPIDRPATWLEQGFFYTQAARRAHGRGRYRLEVSANGKVSGCTVVATTGTPDLDEGGCYALSNLSFTPARDADGQSTTGYWESGAVW